MDNFYIVHDSHNLYFRSPFGAVCTGSTVSIMLEAEGCRECFLELINFDGSRETISMEKHLKDNTKDIYLYKCEINVGDKLGIINYYFVIKKEWQTIYYGNNYEGLGGIGNIYYNNPKPYQITVHKEMIVPSWYKEGVMYQIFVDRFYNGNKCGVISNPKKNSFIYGAWDDEPMYIRDKDGQIIRWDFYGGNLKGVIKKLGYLKSLGISIIYLNPIFESVSSHKYDTGDYKKIDPMYGDESIYKELCEKAEKLGIRVILDGVFSHTGWDSIYFNKFGHYDSIGAYQSKDSPYYDWYRFWNYPNEYECWWGFKNQPNVEELNHSYMDYIIWNKDSVIAKWLKLGASGWRLDVADELPDEFIEAIRKRMKEIKEDSVLIGEVWEDASNKESYGKRRRYLFGNELDSVMGYPFRDNCISFLLGYLDSRSVIRRFMSLYENYPRENFYSSMNLLGSHDTERILTVLSGNGVGEVKARQLLILAVTFLMTFPGVPVIYYGDEIGLKGRKDPENRKTYPWGKEDKEILSLYKKLIYFRNNYDVFKRGDFKFFETHGDVLCFKRELDDSKVIVLINRNLKETIKVEFAEVYGRYRNVLKEEGIYYSANGMISVELKPMDAKILMNIKGQE